MNYTLIIGPEASGKSFKAKTLAMIYPKHQVYWMENAWKRLRHGFGIPADIRLIIVDEVKDLVELHALVDMIRSCKSITAETQMRAPVQIQPHFILLFQTDNTIECTLSRNQTRDNIIIELESDSPF